ncbi:MAG: aminodeoxychorismate lyase [Pseudomonadota bacterium]
MAESEGPGAEVLGSWVDGIAANSVPLDDRGLQYGDGLFETILVRNGRARFLDAHFARLDLGCQRLGIRFAASADLRAEITRAVAHAPAAAILKLIVTRGSGPRRGYAPRGTFPPRRVLTLFAAPSPVSLMEGADARIASLRLAENPVLAGIKHLNRLENVLAAAEPGHELVFESLLLDAAGNIVCGTMSNVFTVIAGRLNTPPVDRCGVAGVMRSVVLRQAAALGIICEQRRMPLADFLAADEVFITNARIGVVPLRRVGEHSFMSNLARTLAANIEPLDA